MTVFDWGAFLALAARLAADVDDEAAQRTAISRAYNAAYHAASRVLYANRLLAAPHSHRTVWNALAVDSDRTRSDIGVRGNTLKRRRQDADYANSFGDDLQDYVRLAVAEARAIVETLDRLS